MRRSFEEKLRTFSQAQNQFEQEKKVALEELKAQHRQEVQELLRSHQSQNANYSKDQEKLVQLHKAEVTRPRLVPPVDGDGHMTPDPAHPVPSQVDSLSERVDELKQDKKRLVEEYEAKLIKVQRRAHVDAACTCYDVQGYMHGCGAPSPVRWSLDPTQEARKLPEA